MYYVHTIWLRSEPSTISTLDYASHRLLKRKHLANLFAICSRQSPHKLQNMSIISGQGRGARNFIKTFLPGATQFHCTMHRNQDVYKICDVASGKTFLQAINAQTALDLQKAHEVYSTTGPLYIGKISDHSQYPFSCGNLFDKFTSQGAETMKIC